MSPTTLSAATSTFAEPTTAPASGATIVHANDGRPVRAYGNEILFKLAGEQTAGLLTLGLATVPAGSGGPPPHVHEREDELFIIVEGRYRVFFEGEWTEVGPGAVVYLPRGRVHTFQIVGEEDGRHWVLTTPSGFEQFYAESAEVFAAPGAPDFARLAAVAAKYGNSFRRPEGAA